MEIAEGERRNIEECGRSWYHRPLIQLEQHSRYRCQSNQWFINHRANYGDREERKRERVRERERGGEREGEREKEKEGEREEKRSGTRTREKDAQETDRQRRERMIS